MTIESIEHIIPDELITASALKEAVDELPADRRGLAALLITELTKVVTELAPENAQAVRAFEESDTIRRQIGEFLLAARDLEPVCAGYEFPPLADCPPNRQVISLVKSVGASENGFIAVLGIMVLSRLAEARWGMKADLVSSELTNRSLKNAAYAALIAREFVTRLRVEAFRRDGKDFDGAAVAKALSEKLSDEEMTRLAMAFTTSIGIAGNINDNEELLERFISQSKCPSKDIWNLFFLRLMPLAAVVSAFGTEKLTADPARVAKFIPTTPEALQEERPKLEALVDRTEEAMVGLTGTTGERFRQAVLTAGTILDSIDDMDDENQAVFYSVSGRTMPPLTVMPVVFTMLNLANRIIELERHMQAAAQNRAALN